MSIQSIIRRATELASANLASWVNHESMLMTDGACSKSKIAAQNSNVPYLIFSEFDNPVPAGVAVTGVAIRITAKAQYNDAAGFACTPVTSLNPQGSLRLMNLTGVIGRGMTAFNKNVLSTKVAGGDADLWGAPSIDLAELNDPSFSVYALFRNGSTTPQSMFIDGLEVEVFYDDGVPDTVDQPEEPIGGNGPVKPPAP